MAVRSKVFLIEGDDVTVHPEAKQRINRLFAGMLPKEQLLAIEVVDLSEGADPSLANPLHDGTTDGQG